MSREAINELKRIRSILSGISGLEDDDQEYIEDARKSVDRIIESLAEQPAQRTWVGLTDEERMRFVFYICNLDPYCAPTLDTAVCAIEAKLREKNA